MEEDGSSCVHEYIMDLIDIDPDRSKIIFYCNLCLHCVDELPPRVVNNLSCSGVKQTNPSADE
jgi:hypothetical protein